MDASNLNLYNLNSNVAIIENSISGKLMKWNIGDKYIKTSTIDLSHIGPPRFMYESYGEIIGYKIATMLGFNATPYKLCKVIIDNQIETVACESDNFAPNGGRYLSIGKLMKLGKLPIMYLGDLSNYESLIELTKQYNRNIRSYIDKLIILDYLILNDDRHFGNFGFLANPNGTIQLVLIFDNGNCCFCHKNIEEFN